MIKKFWKYGKFKEYFAWAFENIFALIGTVLLVIATYYLKIYEDLQNYISILDSTFGVIIGALIGTLALIFCNYRNSVCILAFIYFRIFCCNHEKRNKAYLAKRWGRRK